MTQKIAAETGKVVESQPARERRAARGEDGQPAERSGAKSIPGSKKRGQVRAKGEIRHTGRYQSGQMGQTVNLLAYAFGGSNPSLPTTQTASDKSRGHTPEGALLRQCCEDGRNEGREESGPVCFCGSSSVDRALAFQAKGREFEPRLPLDKVPKKGASGVTEGADVEFPVCKKGDGNETPGPEKESVYT